jgi:hypothetical protein
LKDKELVFSECPVISWARKENHLACNHEADISPNLWRGSPVISSKLTYPAPRCALRMTDRGFMESGSSAGACCAI